MILMTIMLICFLKHFIKYGDSLTGLVRNKTDILIFVEDPSVANYVAALPEAISDREWTLKLYSTGIASEYLKQRNVDFQGLVDGCTADDILESSSPGVLLSGTAENLDTLGLSLIEGARRRGIPAIGIVDATMNAGMRFRGRSDDAMTYAPDWVLAPDQATKEEFTNLGFSAERVVVCGHPQYDYVAGLAAQWAHEDFYLFRHKVFPRALPDQKIVIFICERSVTNNPLSSDKLAQYTLKGRQRVPGRTEIVLEEFLDATAMMSPRPYIVLRIHPKDNVVDYRQYHHELDLISKSGPPLEQIYAADLAVGMTSMLLTEAAIMGRKTLSIIPDAEEINWLPGIRNSATPCATTRAELRDELKQLLIDDQKMDGSTICPDGFVLGAVPKIISLIDKIIRVQ